MSDRRRSYIGPRMVLNGLLLIGWSASFTHIAMERFWNGKEH